MALYAETELESRRQQIYGPGRQNVSKKIREVLQKSHVLQNGEYNFRPEDHKDDIWRSTTTSEFMGQRRQVPNKQPESRITQLDTHFQLGNDSGQLLSNDIFKTSVTRADYHGKKAIRPKVFKNDQTINWPDMAPQYLGERTTGTSEYNCSFSEGEGLSTPRRPTYPRINTSKVKLPIDFEKVRHIKGSHVDLGSDPTSYKSETSRAYENQLEDSSDHLTSGVEDAQKVTQFMKDMDRSSNVFRAGDYNGIVDNSFQTTFSTDYGRHVNTETNILPPASKSDSSIGPRRSKSGEKVKKTVTFLEELEELENKEKEPKPSRRPVSHDGTMPSLFRDSLNNVAPVTFGEAKEGKKDHTSAHFKLGNDNDVLESMYTKDFETAGMVQRTKPSIQPPPRDSEVLQRDPEQTFGESTTANEYGQHIRSMGAGASDGVKTAARLNMERRHGNNVVFSYDLLNHTHDRQVSLSKNDYVAPPKDFKPMPVLKAPETKYKFLETDGALPFPIPKVKTTENQLHFRDTFMDKDRSIERRRAMGDQCRSRQSEGRATHFILGYDPRSHVSEAQDNYTGLTKEGAVVAPAGKVEQIPPFKFAHINHSENLEDMTTEGGEQMVHSTSVMMTDYTSPDNRQFTKPQMVMLSQDAKYKNQPIEVSHFFHMDTTGNRNFETTSMADFIRPEMMSGRKFLAAR